jgi:putative endonuclease
MRKDKGGCTYITTNKLNTVLYIGSTTELFVRTEKHRQHFYKGGFSDKYNAERLIYYEVYDHIEEAEAREKQLKGWMRRKKEALINRLNPGWKDLFDELSPE